MEQEEHGGITGLCKQSCGVGKAGWDGQDTAKIAFSVVSVLLQTLTLATGLHGMLPSCLNGVCPGRSCGRRAQHRGRWSSTRQSIHCPWPYPLQTPQGRRSPKSLLSQRELGAGGAGAGWFSVLS